MTSRYESDSLSEAAKKLRDAALNLTDFVMDIGRIDEPDPANAYVVYSTRDSILEQMNGYLNEVDRHLTARYPKEKT